MLAGKQILHRAGEKECVWGGWGVKGGVSQQNKVRCLLGRVAAGKALWVWRVEQLHVRGPLSWSVVTVDSKECPSGDRGEMLWQCTVPQTH